MYRSQVIAVVKDICEQSKARFKVNPVNKIEIISTETKSNSVIFIMEHSYIDWMGAIDSEIFKIEITVWGKVKILSRNAFSMKTICGFMDAFKSIYMSWYLEEQDASRSIKKQNKDIEFLLKLKIHNQSV